MALISCNECGKDVSSAAPACIHCGYPIAETSPSDGGAPRSPEIPTIKQMPEELPQWPAVPLFFSGLLSIFYADAVDRMDYGKAGLAVMGFGVAWVVVTAAYRTSKAANARPDSTTIDTAQSTLLMSRWPKAVIFISCIPLLLSAIFRDSAEYAFMGIAGLVIGVPWLNITRRYAGQDGEQSK